MTAILFPGLAAARRRVASPQFSPLALPSLALYQTADVGVFTDTARTVPATNDGDLVSGRTDQSGSGNHGSATLLKRPTLKLNILNSLPALLFDGTANYLDCGSGASLDLNGDKTLWQVLLSNATSATRGLIGRWTSSHGYLLWLDAGNVKISEEANPNKLVWIGGIAALQNNAPHLLMAVRRSGLWYLYFDGALKGTATGITSTSAVPFNLGSYGNGGGGKYSGYEFESGVMSAAISDADRVRLQEYYRTRYLITTMAAADAAGHVFYGGIDSLNFSLDAGQSSSTLLAATLTERLRSRGLQISELRIYVNVIGTGAWKAKVFRPNGSNYDFVAECAFTPPATGVQIFVLSSPMDCRPGDVLGVFVGTGGNVGLKTNASGTVRQATGDVATSNAFSTTQTNTLDAEALGNQPFVIGTGDSIMAGHGTGSTGNEYFTHYDGNGPAGDPSASCLETLYLGNTSRYSYQNFGMGSQTFAWVAGTAVPDLIGGSLTPRALLIHCGTNDIGAGRLWSDIQTDLDTIRTLVTWDCEIFVNEILPRNSFSDGQAATVRTYNANLVTYCAAHAHWHLVSCHDALGQVRASTGQIDDLKTAYSMDGTHMVFAGNQALGNLQKAAMDAVFGP